VCVCVCVCVCAYRVVGAPFPLSAHAYVDTCRRGLMRLSCYETPLAHAHAVATHSCPAEGHGGGGIRPLFPLDRRREEKPLIRGQVSASNLRQAHDLDQSGRGCDRAVALSIFELAVSVVSYRDIKAERYVLLLPRPVNICAFTLDIKYRTHRPGTARLSCVFVPTFGF